jgi:hypothetical protein
MEAPVHVDPRGEEEFPEECATEFPYVTPCAVPFPGSGMAVNVNAVKEFVILLVIFSLGTENGDLISVLVERTGLLPHARVEWNGKILDDDEDFSLHAGDPSF